MHAMVSFPAAPGRLCEGWRGTWIRRFGADAGELDSGGEREPLVSDILARSVTCPSGTCIRPEALGEFRLGARIEVLLRFAFLACAGEVSQVLHCEGCGQQNELELPHSPLADLQREVGDLEFTLGDDGGASEQASLLDAVHRLARAYHWSEEALVRLPAWRCRAYLDRIAEETR